MPHIVSFIQDYIKLLGVPMCTPVKCHSGGGAGFLLQDRIETLGMPELIFLRGTCFFADLIATLAADLFLENTFVRGAPWLQPTQPLPLIRLSTVPSFDAEKPLF